MNVPKNKVQLIGNIGGSPEVFVFESGKKLAKFSLATNEFYKSTNGIQHESTTWHNVVAWEKNADLIEKYSTKGTKVIIHGKITYKTFKDENGALKPYTEILAQEVSVLRKIAKE